MHKVYYMVALISLLVTIYFFFFQREILYGAISFLISAAFAIFYASSSGANRIESSKK